MKEMPHNNDMEKVLLGEFLCDNQAANEGFSSLQKRDFYNPAHQIIFETCKAISDRGGVVDIATVSDELMKHDRLNKVGGVAYIAELTDCVISPE